MGLGVQAEVSYITMPVLWHTCSGLDLLSHDIIIHMGLGVYDRKGVLLLERGAFNARNGADAHDQKIGQTLDFGGPQVLSSDSMASRVEQFHGSKMGAFEVQVAYARPENTFICNETHFRA